MHRIKIVFCVLIVAIGCSASAGAQTSSEPASFGPYNGVFRFGGNGLSKPLGAADPILQASSPWSVYFWFQTEEPLGPALLAGVGNPLDEYSRYLGIREGNLILWLGKDNSFSAPAGWHGAGWHFAAATFDGDRVHLFSEGTEIAAGKPVLGRVGPLIQMAPEDSPWPDAKHFGGKIASFTLLRTALTAAEVQELNAHHPDFSLVEFEEASKPWPVQTRAQAGYRAPQDPSQWPHSAAPFSKPVAQPLPPARTALQARGENEWALEGGWKLTPAPKANAGGATISEDGFDTKDWWPATVPGTVLTTMVDRGLYPDPDYGLNNLAIPESLNKQDYWYRAEFRPPDSVKGRHFTLTFNGINYAAEVWLNGSRLGEIKGAFIRGKFDVTALLKPGHENALAVRISPPPHPGIPQEQSIKGGPGENGGIMVLDGPTFVATEGWDWVPGIRDRDTGLWQDVVLSASGAVSIGDPQVVTTLPLPDTSRADVEIDVPLNNSSGAPVSGTITASFDQTKVTKQVTVPPGGETTFKLTPLEFAQLTVQHPRLWWPNGYGSPELYRLKLAFSAAEGTSDAKELTFGIREITYELSLYDSTGHLRRVEISPTVAREIGRPLVDVSHDGMRQIPHGWAASLAAGAESSPAVEKATGWQDSSDLVIKVNGVKIACRGGNWGMDDARKRVSRERLEPYFRLHRDANLNIIRNWVGQSTEEVFYDLADKYGLLVWNDFWESTQDYNLEIEDPALFLANARDTILRFRNHPSIVMWCGRNEGVPQPVVNQGLAELTRTLDGTRYYSPSSNRVNLRNSGPYKYEPPATYYKINHGFSVELGIPSMPTLESFRAWIPKADQWPISDDWAYHDWHQSGNGEVAPFMEEVETEFGAATGLEDFERKAQMLNYVEHRAIFEGFNAHLWMPNSGRMLWMTQPAWPSTSWQILSSDYDTQASFYGVKKACEPVHVQLDLTNYEVDVVNTTVALLQDVSLGIKVYSLDNKLLAENTQKLEAPADALTSGPKLELAPYFSSGIVFVKLTLSDAGGKVLADNFYWLGADGPSYRELDKLPPASLKASATSIRSGDEEKVRVQLENVGPSAALAIKLTLQKPADGARILPAYFSDNYVSLLPGETRVIDIQYPSAVAAGAAQIEVRGWNLTNLTVPVTSH